MYNKSLIGIATINPPIYNEYILIKILFKKYDLMQSFLSAIRKLSLGTEY
jgi:hypothetical protein